MTIKEKLALLDELKQANDRKLNEYRTRNATVRIHAGELSAEERKGAFESASKRLRQARMKQEKERRACAK
jgi:hypothetical protein